jgi:Protein of unknown function (DUF3306)
MSEGENFLARWSSRKLASRTPAAASEAPAQQRPRDDADDIENGAVAEPPKDAATPPVQSFDPAQLPPLDSIGADTDITAFLRRDVPPELTRAALRRAWISDPAIKNFVGLVENGWDFNDPTAMPGFGPITPEEVARLAGTVLAGLHAATPRSEAEVSASEKNRELGDAGAPAAKPLEAGPQLADPACDGGNDAAQQNKPGKPADG